MPTIDEVQFQQNLRLFLQFGGARPDSPLRYAGVDAQYVALDDIEAPVRGDITPTYAQDPKSFKKYKKVGNSVEPPENKTTTVTFMHKQGGIPRHMLDLSCPMTLYQVSGECGDPSDIIGGWSNSIDILADAEATTRTHQNNTSFDSDDGRTTEVPVTLRDFYTIGKLGFGESGSVDVTTEVLDITYGTATSCGNCGPANDGTKQWYAVVKAGTGGSSSAPAFVMYSVDGGATIQTAVLNLAANTEVPSAIRVIGQYVVVFSPTAGGATLSGYYYAAINPDTGAIGAWTKVTAGSVATKLVRDVYVVSSREVYMAADGGYIYKLADVASGVTTLNAGAATTDNLLRIHGANDGQTIWAVGASGRVIRSINRGVTFATTVAAGAASNQALAVLDARRAWVGDSAGVLRYTNNGGASWTAYTVADATAIHDVKFPTDEIGYVSFSNGSAGRLWWTPAGGRVWGNSADAGQARIVGLPTATRYNRIAVPSGSVETNVNNVLLAGLAGGSTDGIIAIGAPNVL